MMIQSMSQVVLMSQEIYGDEDLTVKVLVVNFIIIVIILVNLGLIMKTMERPKSSLTGS